MFGPSNGAITIAPMMMAGALAFTTGVSATPIGVMVTVALLPPLVALSLFLMNLICVNLAGVLTFLVQGIRSASWWEKDRAAKATRTAIALWAALSAALAGMIMLLRKG